MSTTAFVVGIDLGTTNSALASVDVDRRNRTASLSGSDAGTLKAQGPFLGHGTIGGIVLIGGWLAPGVTSVSMR